MNQIYPDVGLVPMLQEITGFDKYYRLFTNNVTPSRTTVVADLTEAAWTGYAAQILTSGNWTLFGVAGHVGTIQAAPQAFLNSSGAPVNAYGYFVTDSTGTILFAAARFDSAPITKADGDYFTVLPIFGDLSVLAS